MAPTEPHPFEAAVGREWPPTQWCDVSVLVAVSGGADSVGLLRALAALHRGDRRNLVVAHFNHQLRSEESDRDQEFVQALAGRLGFACQVGTCRPSSAATRSLSEVAARQERYRFLTALADQLGARYVATGHTADDQAETILHRVIRGTGIGGLSGIPRSRRLSQLTTLIRPLRDLRRRQVLGYLEHLGQPFTNDTTNTQLAFTRNRIRLDLLPQLERDFNPRVQEALCRLAHLADQTQAVIDRQVSALRDSIQLEQSESLVVLDCTGLEPHDAFLLQELLIVIWKERAWPLQEMGLERWQSLTESVSTRELTERVFDLPGRIRGEFINGRLQLSRQPRSVSKSKPI